MAPTNWEADKMLDVYINDYFLKRNLNATARTFQSESRIPTDPVAIDSPGGFLWEWWSVFWDIFASRDNGKSLDEAAPCTEQQQQVPQQQQLPQQQREKRKQEQKQLSLLGQQQQQQQQRSLSDTVNNVQGRRSPAKKSKSASANTSAFKIYEEGFKLPMYTDPAIEAVMKGKRSEIATAPVPKAPSYKELALQAAAGLNQGSSSWTLKGWPLSGLDQLQNGSFPTQKPLMNSYKPINQLQMQQQQQMLQAQQQLASASAGADLEAHKLRLLKNWHFNLGRNYPSSNADDFLLDTGSSLQYGSQNQYIRDIDELLMQQQQLVNNNYIQQLCMKNSLLSQLSSHNPPSPFQLQGQINPSSEVMLATTNRMPSAFTEINQASKYEERQKEQQLATLSPTRSSETANTLGPSSSNVSTHSAARSLKDNYAISSESVPCHDGGSLKSLVVFGTDPKETESSEMGGADCFVDNGSPEDKVDYYVPCEGVDIENQGDDLTEIQLLQSSSSAVECCHFSSDGKLLVTGDSDKKATLWSMESFSLMSELEEHTHSITDVRFSSSMPRLATSSTDGTVRVWSVDNSSRHSTDNIEYSICTFSGHSTAVMSLDFHPCRNDLLCSCDNNSEIRYWSIRNACCAGVFKGGANHIRFQPRHGRFLAAATDNDVSLLDVETQVCMRKLLGHKGMITNVCWDSSGEYLASVSDDLVQVWKIGLSAKAECAQELISGGSRFHSCVFHPTQPTVVILGSYQNMEMWDMAGKRKARTCGAHEGLISSLAASTATRFVASASHDGSVRIWK